MDFMNNMMKSSNAIIRDRLNNIPFGNKQQPQPSEADTQAGGLESGEPQPSASTTTNTTTTATTNSEAINSSATSSDSRKASSDQQPSGSTATENAKQQFAAIAADAEAVTQKAVSGAKNIGSFLVSFANKAGQTVSQTAKQVKQAVESNSILTDFTREQQEFIKEHGGNVQCGELPWCEKQDMDDTKRSEMREQILSLSQDKRNFVRSPPPNDPSYQFEADKCYPVALALLKEDPNLSKMRFELVPKLISEDTFWCNYFYRVSKLKQMIETGEDELASASDSKRHGWASNKSSSSEGPDDEAGLDSEISQSQNLAGAAGQTSMTTDYTASQFGGTQSFILNDTTNVSQEAQSGISQATTTTTSGHQQDVPFKSVTEMDDDLKNKLKELNIGSFDEFGGQDGHDWDEELQRDLQEFEVVPHDLSALDEEDLDKDIREMTAKKT